MNAFLAAMVALIVISFGADYLLHTGLEYSAEQVYSVDGVSLPKTREPE